MYYNRVWEEKARERLSHGFPLKNALPIWIDKIDNASIDSGSLIDSASIALYIRSPSLSSHGDVNID